MSTPQHQVSEAQPHCRVPQSYVPLPWGPGPPWGKHTWSVPPLGAP